MLHAVSALRLRILDRSHRNPVRLRVGLVLGLALLGISSPSLGQTAPVDPARAAFQQGVAAVEDGRFADAVTALEESYRLRPARVVLHNLGVAYRGLGRHREAVDAFRRYLADPPTRATERELSSVRAEVARLERTLVRVQVTLQPEHARVFVDGRETPVVDGALVLDPGAHRLEVRAAGYESRRQELRYEPGSTQQLALRPSQSAPASDAAEARPRGRVQVTPAPALARVYIDGTYAGSGTREVALPAGEHEVQLSADGYQTVHRRVVVSEGGLSRVEATLVPVRSGVSWGIPLAIAGGVAVAGAAVGVGLWLARPTEELRPGTWGLVSDVSRKGSFAGGAR